MKNRYPLEKLAEAVDFMATSDKGLGERIFGAYMGFYTIQLEHLPDRESQDRYKKLKEALTRFKAVGTEGDVLATLARLSSDELRDIAKQIVELRAYLEHVLSD